MGRNKKALSSIKFDEGEAFRLKFGKGNVELASLGRTYSVNGMLFGSVAANWRSALAPYSPSELKGEAADAIEAALGQFARERAAEISAVPWVDDKRGASRKHGALNTIDRLAKATAKLLSAADAPNYASTMIWSRLESIEGAPFTRDEFYPLLSALNQRAHLLLSEMKSEQKRGDELSLFAFRRFVVSVARAYDYMGGKVTVSKISRANEDSGVKPSAFSKFAWEAMQQIPKALRVSDSGLDGRSFIDALDHEVSHLRKIGVLDKTKSSISPRKRSGRVR